MRWPFWLAPKRELWPSLSLDLGSHLHSFIKYWITLMWPFILAAIREVRPSLFLDVGSHLQAAIRYWTIYRCPSSQAKYRGVKSQLSLHTGSHLRSFIRYCTILRCPSSQTKWRGVYPYVSLHIWSVKLSCQVLENIQMSSRTSCMKRSRTLIAFVHWVTFTLSYKVFYNSYLGDLRFQDSSLKWWTDIVIKQWIAFTLSYQLLDNIQVATIAGYMKRSRALIIFTHRITFALSCEVRDDI